MHSLSFWFCLCSLLFTFHLPAAIRQYQLDQSPLQAETELAKQFQTLQDKFQIEALTPAEHQKRMAILEEVIRKKPDWIDGYSMIAAEAFFLGSSFTDPKA